MKASDFVTTDGQRTEAASELVRPETVTMSNSGIVGKADKSAALLDKQGGHAEHAAKSPPFARHGTGARSGAPHRPDDAANSFLPGEEGIAYAAANLPYGDAAAHGGLPADGATATTGGAASVVRKGRARAAASHGARAAAGSLASTAIRDTELEGLDDAYYRGDSAVRATKAVRSRIARSTGAKAQAGSAASHADMQKKALSKRFQAMSRRKAAEAKAAGAGASAKGGAAKASTVAAAGSQGGSGLGAVLAACGAPLLLVFALLAVSLFLGAVSAADQEPEIVGMNGNELAVAQYLRDKGLGDLHIAAIMGNMKAESGINPGGIEEGNAIGHGICQWSFERWDGLQEFAASQGKPWYDLGLQLDFFWMEFDRDWGGDEYMITKGNDPPTGTWVSGSKAGFNAADTVAEATRQFCYGWERPSNPHESPRVQYAEEYYAMLQGGGGGAIAGIGDLQWPSATAQWGTYANHWGLDIQAGGGTPVYAAADGIVIWQGYNGTWGNYVRIFHEGLGVQTGYAHLSSYAVNGGQSVSKGQVIGYVGSTGNSTGPHLHFEIYETSSPSMSYSPIYDDMARWGRYFDRAELEGSRVF